MNFEEKIKEIKKYAFEKHGEQKYSDKEYSYHLNQVFDLAMQHNLNMNQLLASILHDVIEDCFDIPQVGFREVESLTNTNVANIVWAVSGFGTSRKEKKLNILEKIKLNLESIDVKMCDRICNIKESFNNLNIKKLKMYVDESIDYEPIFKNGVKSLHEEYLLTVETAKKILNTNEAMKKFKLN